MLDKNIWLKLSEDEKFAELQAYLDAVIQIDKGMHELSNTRSQGKLSTIKKELQENIFKIIELENAT
jgi:hypothetical protein